MRFLDKLFGRKKYKFNSENCANDSGKDASGVENVKKLLELKIFIESVLKNKKYIAKSDYVGQIKEYTALINFFEVLKTSDMLNNFCVRNRIAVEEVEYVVNTILDIENLVEQHNEIYISETMVHEKEYLDNILKDADPMVLLDADQRRVILTDEPAFLHLLPAVSARAVRKIRRLHAGTETAACAAASGR